MNSKKLKTIYIKVVVQVARKVAVMEANTACPWIGFQPEVPAAVKKLSKLKN